MGTLQQTLNQKETSRRSTENFNKPRNSFFIHDEQQSLSHKASIIKQKDLKGFHYKGESTLEKSPEEEDEELLSSNKSFFQRCFSKIETGSVRASILTIISSMIGVGFLTLPIIGKNSGYIICAVFIL